MFLKSSGGKVYHSLGCTTFKRMLQLVFIEEKLKEKNYVKNLRSSLMTLIDAVLGDECIFKRITLLYTLLA